MSGDRTARAVRAAVEVAAAHVVHGVDPVVLADGFNVVVHLQPAPVVARVVVLPALLRPAQHEAITRELDVAGFLAGRGVPVVRPSAHLPPGPHHRAGFWLSFWEHVEVRPGVPTAEQLGGRLRQLHDVLRSHPADGDVLDVPVSDIAEFLRRGRELVAVPDADLARLAAAFEEITPAVTGRSRAVQQLHGDAHPGNLAGTGRGWLWIDFEETMCGPPEWDLACLVETGELDGAAALRAYGVDADDPALRPYRQLRQLYAEVWQRVLAAHGSS